MDEKVVIDVPAPLLVTSSMDKKKKTAEELFKWAWFSLPVKSSSFKKKNKSARFPMPVLSVKGVLVWALAAAGCVAVAAGITAVIAFANIPIPCSENSKILQCPPDLTPAQGVEVESFGEGFLWLTVPQAVAATMGLLLPRRHSQSRWFLGFVAIVSATLAHYMIPRMALVFIAANPGDIGFKIIAVLETVIFLGGDLLSLLSLLVGGPE